MSGDGEGHVERGPRKDILVCLLPANDSKKAPARLSRQNVQRLKLDAVGRFMGGASALRS